MNIYAFDVDETLEVSAGPIQITKLRELAKEHIVGLCGNWALFVNAVRDWHTFISFVGPMEMTKEAFLEQLATHVKADNYFMVGNILGISRPPADKLPPDTALCHFIKANQDT